MLLLALSSWTLSGCVTKPAMKLWGTQVSSAGAPGLSMNMIMRVENDNGFDIQIRNVRATVVLDGRHVLPPIVASPNTWLRSGQVTNVTVPVMVPWNMVPTLTASAARGPYVRFHVRGFADVTGTRALKIDKDDWYVDEYGTVSSGEILAAAGRGHLPMLPGMAPINLFPTR